MGTKTITIEVDEASGKVLTKDPPGGSIKKYPMADVMFAVKDESGAWARVPIVHVPDYTVIHTKTNPLCRWVFIGGQWILYCT